MLTENHRKDLEDVLLEIILASGNGHQYFCTILPSEIMAEISQSEKPGVLAGKIVESCETSGFVMEPPAMLLLLDYIEAQGKPIDASIRLIYENHSQTAAHPLDAEILVNRLPFADRTQLREIIREMAQPATARPVLVIQGEAYSGKSHCAHLIDHYCFHAAESDGTVLFCRCDAPRREPGREAEAEAELALIGPLDIAKDFMSQLGADPDELPGIHTNKKKWYEELARKLFAVANRNSVRAWFILDGFEGKGMREDTADFLLALAQCFTSGMTPRQHRLVFCGFGHILHAVMGEKIQTYQTGPLLVSDVRSVIAKVLADKHLSDHDRAQFIQDVMQRVTGGFIEPFARLDKIGPRLRAVVATGTVVETGTM